MCEVKHDMNHMYKYNYNIEYGTINIHKYTLHNTIKTHTHTYNIELADGFNISSESVTDIIQN